MVFRARLWPRPCAAGTRAGRTTRPPRELSCFLWASIRAIRMHARERRNPPFMVARALHCHLTARCPDGEAGLPARRAPSTILKEPRHNVCMCLCRDVRAPGLVARSHRDLPPTYVYPKPPSPRISAVFFFFTARCQQWEGLSLASALLSRFCSPASTAKGARPPSHRRAPGPLTAVGPRSGGRGWREGPWRRGVKLIGSARRATRSRRGGQQGHSNLRPLGWGTLMGRGHPSKRKYQAHLCNRLPTITSSGTLTRPAGGATVGASGGGGRGGVTRGGRRARGGGGQDGRPNGRGGGEGERGGAPLPSARHGPRTGRGGGERCRRGGRPRTTPSADQYKKALPQRAEHQSPLSPPTNATRSPSRRGAVVNTPPSACPHLARPSRRGRLDSPQAAPPSTLFPQAPVDPVVPPQQPAPSLPLSPSSVILPPPPPPPGPAPHTLHTLLSQAPLPGGPPRPHHVAPPPHRRPRGRQIAGRHPRARPPPFRQRHPPADPRRQRRRHWRRRPSAVVGRHG